MHNEGQKTFFAMIRVFISLQKYTDRGLGDN